MFRRQDKSRLSTVTVEADPVDGQPRSGRVKGRPTPKQRSAGARGPATPAPTTRKEAVRYQRERLKSERAAGKAPNTPASRRAAMLSGDPNALPRRDQGPLRALARDWVDSRRMASNYMLLILPAMLFAIFIPILSIAMYAVIACFFVEWFITGRRIRALAEKRNLKLTDGAVGLGVYAGMRAYAPRKMRRPAPRLRLGDQI